MQPRRLKYFPRYYALTLPTRTYTHPQLAYFNFFNWAKCRFSLTYTFSFPCSNLLTKLWVFFKVHSILTAPGKTWSPIMPFLCEILDCLSPSVQNWFTNVYVNIPNRINSLVGKPFEVKTIMNASVANVIVSVLFGKRFDYQDTQFLRLLSLIGENVKLIGSPRIVVM